MEAQIAICLVPARSVVMPSVLTCVRESADWPLAERGTSRSARGVPLCCHHHDSCFVSSEVGRVFRSSFESVPDYRTLAVAAVGHEQAQSECETAVSRTVSIRLTDSTHHNYP